ncbi:unnamed protein product [Linum trigynum]|uniref:Uncharacterized protein n=1 Tax=Linum trigynum TaxID=586398 RepID=A0AAV2FWI3_9ROSI
MLFSLIFDSNIFSFYSIYASRVTALLQPSSLSLSQAVRTLGGDNCPGKVHRHLKRIFCSAQLQLWLGEGSEERNDFKGKVCREFKQSFSALRIRDMALRVVRQGSRL